MAPFNKPPHSVTQKRAPVSRDSANAGSRDFGSPTLERIVKGLFQINVTEVENAEEGRTFTAEATFFTKETDFEPDDRIEVAIPGINDKFVVVGVAAKHTTRGKLSHMEIECDRDAT